MIGWIASAVERARAEAAWRASVAPPYFWLGAVR